MDNSPANFKCDTCFKTFARLSDLNDHAVVHVDERQKIVEDMILRQHKAQEELASFECSICRKPIRWRSGVRKHIQHEHNLTGEQLQYAIKWTIDTFSTERLTNPDTQRPSSSTQPSRDRITAKKRRRVDEDTEMDDINSNAPAEVTKINAALQNMKLEKTSEGPPMSGSRNNTPEPDQSNFTDDIQQICSQICRIGNARPECQDSIRLVLFETIGAFASGRCNNDAAEFFRDMAEKYSDE